MTQVQSESYVQSPSVPPACSSTSGGDTPTSCTSATQCTTSDTPLSSSLDQTPSKRRATESGVEGGGESLAAGREGGQVEAMDAETLPALERDGGDSSDGGSSSMDIFAGVGEFPSPPPPLGRPDAPPPPKELRMKHVKEAMLRFVLAGQPGKYFTVSISTDCPRCPIKSTQLVPPPAKYPITTWT